MKSSTWKRPATVLPTSGSALLAGSGRVFGCDGVSEAPQYTQRTFAVGGSGRRQRGQDGTATVLGEEASEPGYVRTAANGFPTAERWERPEPANESLLRVPRRGILR